MPYPSDLADRQSRERSPHRLSAVALAGLVCVTSSALHADPDPGPRDDVDTIGTLELPVGQPIVREHGADARFRYELEIRGDERVVVLVDQRGLDLTLSVTGPDGVIVSVNSPLQRDEREVLVLGGSPGSYLIDVFSSEYTGAVGGHGITAFMQDADLEGDQVRPYAAMMKGNRLNFENDPDRREQALAAYLTAAAGWESQGDERNRAWATFSAAGILYWGMTQWDEAAVAARQAADLYSSSDATSMYAAALHLQAAALMELAHEDAAPAPETGDPAATADYNLAASLLKRALTIQEQRGLGFEAATTVNNLGLLAYYRGDWTAAESEWSRAAARFRSLKEWTGELGSLVNLGVLALQRGSLSDAVSALTRVLEVMPPGEQALMADTLDNRASARLALGDYDAALRDFHGAMHLHQQNSSIKGQGRSLSGIATTYQHLGELSAARESYETSLALREEANDMRGFAATLTQLGNVCRQLGDLGCAFDAHRSAMALAPNEIFRSKARIALAMDYLADGNPESSMEQLGPAIDNALHRGARMVAAQGLLERGKARLALEQYGPARADLAEAQAMFVSMGMPEMTGETLYLTARSHAEEGAASEALALTAEAIVLVEQVRNRLTTPALRAAYLGHSRAAYDLQIEVLMSLAEDAEPEAALALARRALETAEHSRGRMLLDLMEEASLGLGESIEPALAGRRRALTDRMTELAYRRDQLLQGERSDDGQIKRISAEMDAAATELRILDIEIREDNPRFASLSAPDLLDSRAIQQMLPTDTALLLYHVGEERGFLWIVSDDELRWRTLPDRATLDAMGRSAHKLLQVYPADIASRRERDRLLAELGEVLLPPSSSLRTRQRLIIVPDGALHYLPFAALSLPGGEPAPRYLLSEFEIQRLSSASALGQPSIHTGKPAPRASVAVFADPVVVHNDPRAAGPGSPAATRQSWMTDLDRLQRLQWSGEEARAIAELADPGSSLFRIGPEATREAVIGTDLRPYRFVHFATHSFIDTEYPNLSGLVLSRMGRGGPGEGLLQLDQISGLPMDAELVVLSACETALGREIRGEGFVGLTQGFFLAGARQVVASLWRVPDQGTAILMESLYRRLIRFDEPPATALRRAQLELVGERRWADPYYWAGFVLQATRAGS